MDFVSGPRGKLKEGSNARGISTLVATVLVLAVAVTLVGIVASWATGYLEMILGSTGVLVTVENVQFLEPNQIVVTLSNKGTSETTIREVFINGDAVPWHMEVESKETASVRPEQIGRITVPYDWEGHTSYSIKILTSGYFQVAASVTSPKEVGSQID